MGDFGGIIGPVCGGCGAARISNISSGTVISDLTGGLDLGIAVSPIFLPKTFPKLPIPLFASSLRDPHTPTPTFILPYAENEKSAWQIFLTKPISQTSQCVSQLYASISVAFFASYPSSVFFRLPAV